jgi:hypothetical protein
MRLLFALLLGMCSFAAFPAESPVDIDPNTKTQGGADVRGSGANAGAGAQTDNRIETEKSQAEPADEPRIHERGNVAGPDKSGPEKDKPVSERKPQEREREGASKGETATTPR